MRIIKTDHESLDFDNGMGINSDWSIDCCEWNYADFTQIDDLAWATDFDEDLQFEKVDGYGFRFGNAGKMFFVPCYSEQNGYYSSEMDIFFNGVKVLSDIDGDLC